jgi:hypothetical protein
LNEENNPVKNLELYLDGEIEIETEQDDESGDSDDFKTAKIYSVTNNDGIAVFKLSPGKYFAGFTEAKFPEDFVLPENFELNISSDYVTRYTIKIANKSEEPEPQSNEE